MSLDTLDTWVTLVVSGGRWWHWPLLWGWLSRAPTDQKQRPLSPPSRPQITPGQKQKSIFTELFKRPNTTYSFKNLTRHEKHILFYFISRIWQVRVFHKILQGKFSKKPHICHLNHNCYFYKYVSSRISLSSNISVNVDFASGPVCLAPGRAEPAEASLSRASSLQQPLILRGREPTNWEYKCLCKFLSLSKLHNFHSLILMLLCLNSD